MEDLDNNLNNNLNDQAAPEAEDQANEGQEGNGAAEQANNPTVAPEDRPSCYDLVPVAGRQEENSWNLPVELANYVNLNSRTFVPSKQLREQILDFYPVPSNTDLVPSMDEYMTSIMRSNSTIAIQRDDELKAVQEAVRHVNGPLADAWTLVEQFRKEPENPDNALDAAGLAERLQFAIALIGQATNRLSFYRRVNALTSIEGFTQRKSAEDHIKKQSDSFNSDLQGRLFGDAFAQTIRNTQLQSNRLLQAAGQKRKTPFRGGRGGKGARSGQNSCQSQANNWNNNPYNNKRGGGPGGFHGGPRSSSSNNNWRGRGKFVKFSVYSPHGTRFVSSKTKGPKYKARRQHKVFQPELGKGNRGQIHTENCLLRLDDTSTKSPSSNSSPEGDSFLQGGEGSSGCRSDIHAENGSDHKNILRDERFYQLTICETQKRWQIETNNKPKTFEPFCTLPKVQNGKLPKHSVTFEGGRSDGEVRSKGCVLAHSNSQGFPKTSEVQVGNLPLYVHSLAIWTGTIPKDFYENNEGSYFIIEKAIHPSDSILRRPSTDREGSEGNRDGKEHSHFPFRKPGTTCQLHQIHVDSIANLRVSWDVNKFNRHDHNPSNRESQKNSGTMQNFLREGPLYPKRGVQSNRETVGNSARNPPCSDQNKIPANGPNSGTQSQHKLGDPIFLIQPVQGRDPLVDREYYPDQREPNLSGTTTDNHTLRRSQNQGLGRTHTRRPIDRGPMDSNRKEGTYKYPGVTSCRASIENFPEREGPDSCSHRDGQHRCTVKPPQNGEYVRQYPDSDSKTNLGFPYSIEHQTDRQLAPIEGECHSRQNVEGEPNLKRMASQKERFPEIDCNLGGTRHRLLCLTDNASVTKVHEFQSRPPMFFNEGLRTRLDPMVPLSVPSFLSNRQMHSENKEDSSSKSPYDSSAMAGSTLVPPPDGTMSSQSHTPASDNGSSNGLQPRTSPINPKHPLAALCFSDYRSSLVGKGLSERTRSLLLETRSAGTVTTYSSSWSRWTHWCNEQSIDPINSPIEPILEFLTFLFHQGLELRTIEVARSSISAYHAAINGRKIGDHPLVSTLIKAISKKRPKLCRYPVIWDVSNVLTYLKSLVNEDISLRLLKGLKNNF